MATGGHFGSPIWAILDDRKSLPIAFLAISDRYTTFFRFFFSNGRCGHFGSPNCAKNNRVLPLCVINVYAKYEFDRWILDTVRDATSFLSIFFTKWPPEAILFFRLMPKIIKFFVIWDLNGYGEYEFDWCTCICDKVMACTSVGVRRRRRRRQNQKHNTPEKISGI